MENGVVDKKPAAAIAANVDQRKRQLAEIARELDARAADEAVWLALHLCDRAGYADLTDSLFVVKAETAVRRRAIYGE